MSCIKIPRPLARGAGAIDNDLAGERAVQKYRSLSAARKQKSYWLHVTSKGREIAFAESPRGIPTVKVSVIAREERVVLRPRPDWDNLFTRVKGHFGPVFVWSTPHGAGWSLQYQGEDFAIWSRPIGRRSHAEGEH
jgi:hypothetical protein